MNLIAEISNLSTSDWIIIGGLCSAITVLCVYIKHLITTHSKEQKENLVNMISAMGASTKALEGNTKVIDEMKALIHSVNNRLIRIDAKNED